MKINFSQELEDIMTGGSMKYDNDRKATLALVSIESLLSNYSDELKLSADKKLFRYDLANKVKNGGEVDLTVEEIVEIKDVINKRFGTLVTAPAYKLLAV